MILHGCLQGVHPFDVFLFFFSRIQIFSPLRSKWEGSEGIAWLMGTNGKNIVNGEFYLDRKPQPKHIAGPFMTEGSYTKNSDEEIRAFMEKLSQTIG